MTEEFLYQAKVQKVISSCRSQALDSTLTNCSMLESDEKIKIHHGIYRETNYDIQTLDQLIEENEPSLLDDQRKVYHCILDGVKNDNGVTFYIDALAILS